MAILPTIKKKIKLLVISGQDHKGPSDPGGGRGCEIKDTEMFVDGSSSGRNGLRRPSML